MSTACAPLHLMFSTRSPLYSLQHRPLVSNSTYHTTLLHDLLAVRHSTKRSAVMFQTGARPIYGTNGPSQNRHSYPDSSKGKAGAPMYKLFTHKVAISTQSHTDRKSHATVAKGEVVHSNVYVLSTYERQTKPRGFGSSPLPLSGTYSSSSPCSAANAPAQSANSAQCFKN